MTSKMYLNQVLPVEIFRIIDEYLFYDLYNERIVSHYRWQKVLSDEESSDSDVSCKLCHYCRERFMCNDILVHRRIHCKKTGISYSHYENQKNFNLKYYLCDSCSKYHERCNFLLMLGKHSLQMKKIKIPEYLEIWRGEKENWYFKEGVSTTDKIKFWKKKEKEDKIREEIYSGIKSKRGNSYITAIDQLRVEKMVTSMARGTKALEDVIEPEIPRGTIAELDPLRAAEESSYLCWERARATARAARRATLMACVRSSRERWRVDDEDVIELEYDSEQEDDSNPDDDSELETPRTTIAELGFDTVDELRAYYERWHSEEYDV